VKWLDIDQTAAGVPLPKGYRFELLKRCDISGVVGSVLVAEGELLRPQKRNLTPGTRNAFRQLFPEQILASVGD
jgi:hypothetical protein